MKKNPFFLVSFITISAIILVACTPAGVDELSNGGEVIGSDIPSIQSTSQIVSPVDTAVPPPPPTADVTSKPPGELLPIPEVQFGPGSDWFRPTPPETIQLASGGLQLFEFSAVW